MRFSIKPSLSFILFLLAAHSGHAQRYMGIATSDWNAINSVYLNPANIADCREKISINVLSVNVAADNNLGTLPKIEDFGNVTNGGKGLFTNAGGKEFNMLAPEAELRGPGIMVSIGKKQSLALTSDMRVMNQFNHFDQSLYNVISNPNYISPRDYSLKTNNFNWTANMWSEIGLTYGAAVYENERSRINLGITLRRLSGIAYISVVGNRVDINYKAGNDTFYAANSDIAFASNVVNDSTAVYKGINSSNVFNRFFGQSTGSGVGADIGFTYRYRVGEPELEDYMEYSESHDLVFSASVTDIGGIHYYNSTSGAIGVAGSGPLTGKGLSENSGSLNSFKTYTRQQGFVLDTQTATRKVALPTALLMSGDAQIYGRFCANLLFIGNIANRKTFGNSYYNQVTLTPRYDYHLMTIALPITYSALAHDVKLGIGLRYSGFFIGSDDVLAVISKYQYGFGVYMGGYIPLFKKKNDPLGYHWHR